MAYLACNELAVGYDGRPVATRLSFAVGPGDLLCVIGENGAGKSTLIRTLLGLLAPVEGEVSFGDGLVSGEVGYLPQQGDVQRDFPASVGEIVLSGCLSRLGTRLFFGKEERRIANEALGRVGVSNLRNRPFSELSGGQQQRVLLARALCAASRLIVLDEPTTGLDPEASHSLYELLDNLRADGMAIIAVTHDVREALGHATHVLALDEPAPLFATVEEYKKMQQGDVR